MRSRITTPEGNGQAYYWENAWQAGEQESLKEIAAGEVRVFNDPAEAIRYLLSINS